MDFSNVSRSDLQRADARGEIKYTVLPASKPRRSDLIMSMTKGLRTNTNRQGREHPHATRLT